MSDTLDVTQVVAWMNENLVSLHFKPRDADGSDFQYGDDRTLRFKTGTSRGEVAIQVWKNDQCTEVIRILNVDQMVEAKHQIDKIISDHQAVVIFRDDSGGYPFGPLKDRPGSASSY